MYAAENPATFSNLNPMKMNDISLPHNPPQMHEKCAYCPPRFSFRSSFVSQRNRFRDLSLPGCGNNIEILAYFPAATPSFACFPSEAPPGRIHVSCWHNLGFVLPPDGAAASRSGRKTPKSYFCPTVHKKASRGGELLRGSNPIRYKMMKRRRGA